MANYSKLKTRNDSAHERSSQRNGQPYATIARAKNDQSIASDSDGPHKRCARASKNDAIAR